MSRTMTAALRLGTLIALVTPLSGAWAATEIADPRFSIVSPVLVGNASGDAMTQVASAQLPATPGFSVTPRDVNNTPLLNKPVTLDFSASGLRLYATQDPGCAIDCGKQTLTISSGISGTALFHPRFAGFANGRAVEVACSGVILADVPARSTDMDAQGGSTGLGDFTRFAPLFLAASTTHPEADFDASGGAIGLGDFTLFAREFLSGASGAYCGFPIFSAGRSTP